MFYGLIAGGYSDVVTFNSHGTESKITIHYGVVPVRLPDLREKLA